MPLDSDEFMVLESSAAPGVVHARPTEVTEALNRLPLDGRSFKFKMRNAACPGDDECGTRAGRRALGDKFALSSADKLHKTFYAGGDQFVSTDDGHHYGLATGDLGAQFGDQWANLERHFLFTDLTLLHFQNPPYSEW